MTPSQLRLYQRMNKGSNSMELLPGGQVSTSSGIGASISQIVGNPAFKAEISLQVTTRYYSQAVVGTPAPVVPPAGQQNPLPLYIFGNIDWLAKYARARQQVPGGAGFTYADMSVIAVGDNATQTFIYPLPHAVAACEPAALCALFSNWCFLEGNVVPFDEARLQQLYNDHDGYVSKFNAAADKMFSDGFVTQTDLEEMKTGAANSDVLK